MMDFEEIAFPAISGGVLALLILLTANKIRIRIKLTRKLLRTQAQWRQDFSEEYYQNRPVKMLLSTEFKNSGGAAGASPGAEADSPYQAALDSGVSLEALQEMERQTPWYRYTRRMFSDPSREKAPEGWYTVDDWLLASIIENNKALERKETKE